MLMQFQGDLGFLKLPDNAQIPENFVELTREGISLVLAKGTVSGHTHAIKDTQAKVYFDPKGPTSENGFDEMYIICDNDVSVTHEEHDTIILLKGIHKKRNQKEYTFDDEYRVISD